MTKVVRTVDNFDATVIAQHTETFVWRGVAYTLDLSEANVLMMEGDFNKYVNVAERLGQAKVVVNDEEIVKPRAKPAKQRRATPPEHAIPPAPLEDEFPPNEDWLHAIGERKGPGAHERRKQGEVYRKAMRDWLRVHGYANLSTMGIVPQVAVDAYWDHVTRIRAERASVNPT